ncbi:smad nuclear-interacting protein 1 [Pseudomyrmex gracilis]|uniref:smad nuclear-interacting protein 1 n=1 Tax=Pseudomyrmex gracilis TaxID=219809 RepID=UPI000995808A|nr:smad nuclear-interacting protein 1 [Pseudomyrmex gracilis]XP_020283796.1 smad nuclear-interacting protein 1 [Pseudomyrmex gracilis]XP_020283797.1 smad nuclear-interacting protein 1 [Pseudomyrmex gracilis]
MSRSSHSNKADRRDTYRGNKEDRHERNNDSHRERLQGEKSRDRDNRSNRRDYSRRDDEKQNDKKRHERSPPPRRDNSHFRHRDKNERSRSRDRKDDSGRRRGDYQYRQKKSPEEVKVKREPSPVWGKSNVDNENKLKQQEKEKPNFELSGKLTEDQNTVNGVVIKYSEPQDARKPKRRWRLYPFKGEKALPTLYIHRQSAYLMGRDRKVADIPLDHPSCSKQHAVLQYRLVSYKKEGGGEGRRIRPYIIDLESANGTFVNNVKLEPRRFHELLEKDVIKFGFSSREYVLLHEHSKDDSLDDDVPLTNETT